MDLQMFIGGRGVACAALQLPDAHVDLWRSFSVEQLIEMGRHLVANGNRDVPESVDVDSSVWGDEKWFYSSGIDLADEAIIELWVDNIQADIELSNAVCRGIVWAFENEQLDITFNPKKDKNYLIYWNFEKAGYLYNLGCHRRFDVDLLSITVYRFIDNRLSGFGCHHRIISDVCYDGRAGLAEIDYRYDCGVYACIHRF